MIIAKCHFPVVLKFLQECSLCLYKIVPVLFWWKFDIRVCFLSYRSEVVIKNITHSCRICNGPVIKLNWIRYCNIFNWDYSFDCVPSIFNVIPIIFKILCTINLIILYRQCRKEFPVCFILFMKNSLYLWILFIDEFL